MDGLSPEQAGRKDEQTVDRDGRPVAQTIELGVIKGWVAHRLQQDRLATVGGRIRWVQHDGREGSPTCGEIQIVTVTGHNRALLVLPPRVWHAAQNVGSITAWFVNPPTRAYRHEDPDKYRLPLDTDKIPFRFSPSAS